MPYSHTQKGPLGWLLASVAGGFALGSYAVGARHGEAYLLAFIAITVLFAALSFARLKVEDAGDALRVRYGPIGVFGTQIPYSSIRAVEPARTALIDGWGIHWIPWRGWTFNLWGRDCVKVKTDRRTVRVGTDDAQNLARFLKSRAAA